MDFFIQIKVVSYNFYWTCEIIFLNSWKNIQMAIMNQKISFVLKISNQCYTIYNLYKLVSIIILFNNILPLS